MSIQGTIRGAALNYLKEAQGVDVVKIIEFDDETESGGGCNSCYYEYAVVDIRYKTSSGSTDVYRYRGGFSDLIIELERYS